MSTQTLRQEPIMALARSNPKHDRTLTENHELLLSELAKKDLDPETIEELIFRLREPLARQWWYNEEAQEVAKTLLDLGDFSQAYKLEEVYVEALHRNDFDAFFHEAVQWINWGHNIKDWGCPGRHSQTGLSAQTAPYQLLTTFRIMKKANATVLNLIKHRDPEEVIGSPFFPHLLEWLSKPFNHSLGIEERPSESTTKFVDKVGRLVINKYGKSWQNKDIFAKEPGLVRSLQNTMICCSFWNQLIWLELTEAIPTLLTILSSDKSPFRFRKNGGASGGILLDCDQTTLVTFEETSDPYLTPNNPNPVMLGTLMILQKIKEQKQAS